MFQKNRGKPLDYHYTEYSMHYNLCSQLASRIRNFNGGVNTPGYNQLRQQFNAQFKQRDKDASVMLQSSPAEIAQRFGAEIESDFAPVGESGAAEAGGDGRDAIGERRQFGEL